MFYDRPHLVKKWIVGVGLTEKQQDALKRLMPKKDCFFKPWPALEMKAELKKLESQGYADHFSPMPFFLNLTLALRAVVNITRNYNPVAQISPRPPYHRTCQNRIEKEEDYTRLADDILRANDDVTLSQVFATADHENSIWVSFEADKTIVQNLSREFIFLGNGDRFDIDLSNLSGKPLNDTISAVFK